MKKIYFLLLFIFLIFSCSDNSSNPSNDPLDARNFLPMSVGNYWIYEYTELDRNNEPIGDVMNDSTVITGTRDYKGTPFFIFVTFRNGNPIDTSFWNADNLKINQIANQTNTNIPKLSDSVFKMLELYKEDWFIFQTENDSMVIDWDDTLHLVAGKFNYHGYRNYGDDTVYINGKKYIAISTKVVSDRQYQLWDSTRKIFLHNQPCYYYYAENIGRVMIRQESHYIVEQGNAKNKFYFNGWRQQMIRFNVK